MTLFVFLVFAGAFFLLFLLKGAIEKGLSQMDEQSTHKENSSREAASGTDSPIPFPSRKESHLHKAPKVSFAWTWMQCAGKFGYTYLRQGTKDLYPVIEGTEGSCKIRICAVPARSGNRYDTVMEVEFPIPAGLGLHLSDREKALPRLDAAEYFENRNLQKLFLALKKETLFRKEYAAPCEKFLLKHMGNYAGFALTDRFFQIRYNGTEKDPERMEEQMEHLVDAGQFFSALSEHVSRISAETENEKVKAPQFPSDSAATPVYPAAVQLPVEKPDSVPVQQVAPDIPSQKTVQKKQLIPAEGAEEVKRSPGQADEEVTLSKEAVLHALWNSSFPGNAEKMLFENTYKNKQVCWDGVLRGAFPYNTDFVFGQHTGVKSTIDLLEITQGNSSFKVMIKAQISFPPEEAQRLRNASGKQIVFQGTLLKYEPLSRQLYLSGGMIHSVGE